MYGFYLIITRKLSTSDNPLLTLLLTGVVGAIIVSSVMPFVWVKPTLNQWSMMAAIGIFACIGHLFLILSLKYADASKLAPFSYFEIVTNIIIGYYIFSDFPDKWTFLGLFIIIFSLLGWMFLPVMDGFAKYLSTDLPVLQITWARYFFTVAFTLPIMFFVFRQC